MKRAASMKEKSSLTEEEEKPQGRSRTASGKEKGSLRQGEEQSQGRRRSDSGKEKSNLIQGEKQPEGRRSILKERKEQSQLRIAASGKEKAALV
jgi:hypothetical protein